MSRLILYLDVQLSSFHIVNTSLSEDNIQEFANSCATRADGSIVDLDDIELQTDARLVIPSQCDGKYFLNKLMRLWHIPEICFCFAFLKEQLYEHQNFR